MNENITAAPTSVVTTSDGFAERILEISVPVSLNYRGEAERTAETLLQCGVSPEIIRDFLACYPNE